jgi:hypothetical protein
MLDPDMRKGNTLYFIILIEVERTKSIDATPAFVREDYLYLKKSKKTLLMFRRISSLTGENKLELRH